MSLRLLRVARQRWRALFRRDAVDDELASELSFHIEQLTQAPASVLDYMRKLLGSHKGG